ncbi:hypothetical protein, conserved [Eimeria brunetti]|uniref:Uncharacterized protein n=1 Tax=Eimeria brunetti TaxID=51314 RepID=U6M1V4_9EIME|nr:hypothetical protein, conserved [Eimeria brunetti]
MCLPLKTDKGVMLASKNLRRKARHYVVSVDRAFDEIHSSEIVVAAVKREDSPEGSSTQAHDPGHPEGKQAGSRSPCPENVQLHSFEVWVPLSEIKSVKLLPLKASLAEETGTSTETAHEGDAATTALPEAFAALAASSCIGEPSTQYKNFCLVAGEVGVSVGSVYTSLTAFTDADSAGTTQLTASRLLLRKAGYELLDLGMNIPYKASLGAKPLPREVFLKLFRQLRDRKAEPLDATMQHCYESAQAAAQPPREAPEQPKGKWVRRGDEASRPSKEVVKKPSESAADTVNTLSLPAGFVRSVDLFRLLDVP